MTHILISHRRIQQYIELGFLIIISIDLISISSITISDDCFLISVVGFSSNIS